MIPIPNSLSAPESSRPSYEFMLDTYLSAIRNIAQYTLELDPAITALHRRYLEELANAVAGGSAEALLESRATVRGLLREYRDYGSQYLSNLRKELSDSAAALEQIFVALGQNEGDHDLQQRKAITQLRSLANRNDQMSGDIALTVAASIEASLEDMRNQHRLTVSQFLIEIRMLHQRIHALESAASIDKLTQLLKREEIEHQIRNPPAGDLAIVLLKTNGLLAVETQFSQAVMAELAGAFTKRLRNCLPPQVVIGRWSDECFVVILPTDKMELTALGNRLSDSLNGPYSCLQLGKPVRPVIGLRVEVIHRAGDSAEKVLQNITRFACE